MSLYAAYRRYLYCQNGKHRYTEQHRIDLTTDEYIALYECRDCEYLYVLTRHAEDFPPIPRTPLRDGL